MTALRIFLAATASFASMLFLVVDPAAGAVQSQRSAGKLDGAYIVVLESSAGNAGATTDSLERKRGFRARLRFRRALRGFAARLTQDQAARLRQDPAVAYVAPDRPLKALGEVALASGDSAPTGVRRMGAGSLTTAREASTARVAVMDTGIDLSHPDLNAADGINCVTPGAPARDDHGHGTHVAGTISAENDGRGVVGVAPGTRTVAVKVLDAEGVGSLSQALCGVDWVTATRTDSDPSNDIAVANLSLGGTGPPVAQCGTTTDPLHQAICSSTRAGVTYVVAAGNDGWDFDDPLAPDLPAAYPEVLTVTAMSDSDGAPGAAGSPPACSPTEVDDRYASFSNYAATGAGAAHTVAGPGVCIRSTLPTGGYGRASGTSMASPHLAGAVALCLAEAGRSGPCAGLSPASIIARMRDQARARAATTPGYGFVGDPERPVSGRYFGHLAWVAPGDVSDAPGSPATSSPAPPPPSGGSSAAADRTAPTVVLSVRRRGLATTLRRGLAVALRCSEECVAAAELWLPHRTATRLRLTRRGAARIGRRPGIRLAANARRVIVIKLSRNARRRLARLPRLTVTLRVTVLDASGNRRVASRRVTIRR